jgi:predicted dienelactone hydrolase
MVSTVALVLFGLLVFLFRREYRVLKSRESTLPAKAVAGLVLVAVIAAIAWCAVVLLRMPEATGIAEELNVSDSSGQLVLQSVSMPAPEYSGGEGVLEKKYESTIVIAVKNGSSTKIPMGVECFYDPLAVSAEYTSRFVDLTVQDSERNRDIPIRVYLPQAVLAAPVVLFSHGLGGSREGSGYLGKHWAARGYVTVFLQHPGSDTSVWKDEAPRRRMQAMREAASARNFLLRVKDIPAVLDQLDQWNKMDGHELAGRLDLRKVGMSGHSFGAVTTQAVSGQTTGRGKELLTDPRIDAAVIMSPSSPRRATPESAFGKISLPWMLMTGTKDTAPIGNADMKSRLAVFPALPPGGKYELVLFGAEHSSFTDRALPGDTEPRNPNHHRIILALSTAFWDAFLLDIESARQWLDGDGPRSVLDEQDKWRKK